MESPPWWKSQKVVFALLVIAIAGALDAFHKIDAGQFIEIVKWIGSVFIVSRAAEGIGATASSGATARAMIAARAPLMGAPRDGRGGAS